MGACCEGEGVVGGSWVSLVVVDMVIDAAPAGRLSPYGNGDMRTETAPNQTEGIGIYIDGELVNGHIFRGLSRLAQPVQGNKVRGRGNIRLICQRKNGSWEAM